MNLLSDAPPYRVRQPFPALGAPGHELMGDACEVSADQCGPAAPMPLGKFGQGEPGGGDVVGGGVGARVPRSEAGRPPASWCRRVRDRRSLSADGARRSSSMWRRRPASRSAPVPTRHPGPRSRGHPYPVPRSVPASIRTRGHRAERCGPRPGHGRRCGEAVDQTGDGRVGGRPEHVRLGPQHAGTGQPAPAQRDRERHIQQDLARIVQRQGASAADIAVSSCSCGRSRPAAHPRPGRPP